MIYALKVRNKNNIEIIAGQVAVGSTFKLNYRSIAKHELSGVSAFLRPLLEREVGCSIEAITALCLQFIWGLLRESDCWCFSIAFDCATNNEESYIDVRIKCFTTRLKKFSSSCLRVRKNEFFVKIRSQKKTKKIYIFSLRKNKKYCLSKIVEATF